ncbi:hypothetical protein HO173_002774 [Letharia columbiana]|uniref:Uncharacterized protein n=1 Tax=Letharia columbiana TaxID=112416 RepID=A0A8H6G1R3_9LECA|nr:uncharacterized protein HO173_002774 [Letharia columbiana]KAF6238902.1 hypothetical protein HO173_002774 [Letharia columbiana]
MKTPMKSIATLLGHGVIELQRSSTPSGHVPRFLELVTLSMIRSTITGEVYDLPQPLPFEEQRYIYDSGSRLRPTAFYDRENFGREPGHAASWWGSEESIPALEFEEHRARVPDALPSLNNRIESGTDRSSPSSISTRHGSRSPEEASQSGGSTTSTQPDRRTQSSMRSSARRPRRNQSSSRDAQLAAAWQQLYHERTELEKERRALSKKE